MDNDVNKLQALNIVVFIAAFAATSWVGLLVPKLDGDWGDWEPGNYGFDPFKLDSPARREAELKNGRAAMIAFSGLVTQAALGAAPEAAYSSF